MSRHSRAYPSIGAVAMRLEPRNGHGPLWQVRRNGAFGRRLSHGMALILAQAKAVSENGTTFLTVRSANSPTCHRILNCFGVDPTGASGHRQPSADGPRPQRARTRGWPRQFEGVPRG